VEEKNPCEKYIRKVGGNITDVTPCILSDPYQRFRGINCLYIQGRRVLFILYFSTLKIEAAETLLTTCQTTRRHIPEECNIHNHRSENHKSNSKEKSI
jgi:hypothetical protein